LEENKSGCPFDNQAAYATRETLEDLSYHLTKATFRQDRDGSIFRVFAGNPTHPEQLVCEHLWPFNRSLFMRDAADTFTESRKVDREEALASMREPRAEAQERVRVRREAIKETEAQALARPAKVSRIEIFQGEQALGKLDALWAETIDDQEALERVNPEVDEMAAGEFVMHFPSEEQCPSTRSSPEEATAYPEEELYSFATMLVLVNKVRNWVFFYDTQHFCGTLVRCRMDAYLPGLSQHERDEDLYLHYIDTSHGWLRVSVEELTRLGIAEEISAFSPIRDGYQYLEEDCDMAVFMRAKAARNEPVVRKAVLDDGASDWSWYETDGGLEAGKEAGFVEMGVTQRGFALGKFTDRYGHACSIQKSSLATEDAIWLGIDDAEPQLPHGDARKLGIATDATSGWVPYPLPDEVLLTTRMHLNREQVRKLLPVLKQFVASGEIN
jgi:predicted RNase H-like HicB family nuclease